MRIIDQPSLNCNVRRGVAGPDMVVIHYTAMKTAQDACSWLCDPGSEVSAHYLIAEDGTVFRLVDEHLRAWHAGRGAWGSVEDVNSHAIGIELQNAATQTCFPPFPETQMLALEGLLKAIMLRWTIPVERVLGHMDTSPGRKIDPGPKFDWQRLARRGLSAWPEVPGTTEPLERQIINARFLRAAFRIGYRKDGADALSCITQAFRLRFRPAASTGGPDATDVALAEALADSHPCKA